LSVERKEIKLKFGDAIRTRNTRAAVRSHRQPAQIILLVAMQTINLLSVFQFADYYNPFVFFFAESTSHNSLCRIMLQPI
jgi:hypothetical protein